MTQVTNGHGAVAGRPDELRALTDAVRRLVALTVTHVAPAAETAAIAAELEAIADRLEPFVPTPVLPRFWPNMAPTDAPMADQMPFDAVVGAYNPIALPVTVTVDPPRAFGHACFTTAYEGPPGCVQGGVIAATFDIILSAANRIAEAAGPTAELKLRYRKPTLLHRDLVVEAEVAEVRGRLTRTVGQIVQDGEVTVEAEGTFVALDRAAIEALRHRRAATE
jgi:acyl-coenzyme A thioesterase PaaI-like protein